MKNIKKNISTGIILIIALLSSLQVTSMFKQAQQKKTSDFSFGTPTQQQPVPQTTNNLFKNAQQTNQPVQKTTLLFKQPTQPHEDLNWTLETARNLKQLIKTSQESTEIIKKLSDKTTVLEDTIKVMQASIDTLKDTVSQNYATTMKMLNETLRK